MGSQARHQVWIVIAFLQFHNMAVLGVESMSTMPVADRVNFTFFEAAPSGSAVRVGGRFKEMADADHRILTTTDGRDIAIVTDNKEFHASGFVEVVGTKVGSAQLNAVGLVPLGEDVDVELWDQSVQMTHMPQLRVMFQPAV